MRKYTMFTMLLLTMVLCMTACQGAKDDDKQNSEIETEHTEVDTSVNSETEVQVEPEVEIVVLTEEELDWFENSFFNTEDNQLINKFLISQYHHPEDIDLYQLFYGGAYTDGTSEVSDEEIQLLKDRYEIMEDLDIFKVTTAEMDAILQKYMGITLEESNKVHLDSLYYLEEYDAYYSVVGDTNYMRYDFDYGWKNADGVITIEYRFDEAFSSNEELYSVTLKEVNGTYYFVLNETVK